MSDITITLHNPLTGQSESLPIANTMTVAEVLELAKALLVTDAATSLSKDGKALGPLTASLAQAGVTNGDLLLVVPPRHQTRQQQQRPASIPTSAQAPGGGGSGGLDFSNLLAGSGASPSSSSSAAQPSMNQSKTPVYYQGMQLADAMEYNVSILLC